MMNELDSRTLSPWGISTTGPEMAWVRTAEGLRMRWTLDGLETRSAVVEIDAVRNTQPTLAA
jgi:hypothetical protein